MLMSYLSGILFKKLLFPFFVFISFTAVTSTLLLSSSERCFGATYYVATNGSDQNSGSISAPWKTIENSINRLNPGDTLYLRGGTYYQRSIRIEISGTESNKITIKNYPNEVPTIDSGYTEFRKVPNSDWAIYDAAKDIYRSVKTYPNLQSIQGCFGSENGNYRLVAYRSYSDLSSSNENYVNSGSIYIGPGVFWDKSTGRIYVRLKPSIQEISMGYNIPSNRDPRLVSLYIFQSYEIVGFMDSSSYIGMEGINLSYRANGIIFRSGSHNISVKNSNIKSGNSAININGGAHDLVIDNIRVDHTVPPWIAFSDVKIGTTPGRRLSVPAINIEDSAKNIEIRNCLFRHTWDGFNISDATNVHIHHNTFEGTRDDVVQLESSCSDIEINHNRMLYVSKGVSRHGSGSSLKPGTKYIHHNIIDCSKSMLGARKDPNNLISSKYHGPNGDGMVWVRPFGLHEGSGFGGGDPWKIYNNTLIFGEDLNAYGAGHEYTIDSFYSNIPQEVYNNIIIQMMGHTLAREVKVSDGSQINDGNVYYRSATPENYFLRLWENGSTVGNFKSLSEFKSSKFFAASKVYYSPGFENSGIESNPRLDGNYYPDPDGPAAYGAISLPSDWPGRDGMNYRGALAPMY